MQRFRTSRAEGSEHFDGQRAITTADPRDSRLTTRREELRKDQVSRVAVAREPPVTCVLSQQPRDRTKAASDGFRRRPSDGLEERQAVVVAAASRL